MIDNYEETMALIKKMEAHLPIPAQPTKRFIHGMRKDGIKVKSTQKIQIENVLYLGDDGGIGCEVGIFKDGTVVITSLTHIRVKNSHPIGKEIRRYQNDRINKLALQNIQRERGNLMNMTEFIGYYASFPGDRAIVNEDASVIVFGKKHDFISYHENHPEKVTDIPTYKKIYYEEIIQGIYEGNSFAFDEISYNRFYPIAQLNGYDFGPADFSTNLSNNYDKKFATLKIGTEAKIIT